MRCSKRLSREMSVSRVHPLRPNRGRRLVLAWCVVVASVQLVIFNGLLLPMGVGGIVQRGYWLAIVLWLFLLAQPKSDEAPNELSDEA